MKKCSKCKEVKVLTEFCKDKSRKDGLNIYCKPCKRKGQRVYRENNPEKVRERQRVYRENNLEKVRERKRTWKKNNLEKVRERQRIYRENNREKVRERNRVYRENNPEKARESRRTWQKNNPEKAREYNRKRRAMKLEVNENYTPEDERYTRLIFSEMCFKCKSKENLTIDHNYPLSEGNALERDNAVLLCQSCNSSKGTKRPEEFYSPLELYQLEYLLYMEY